MKIGLAKPFLGKYQAVRALVLSAALIGCSAGSKKHISIPIKYLESGDMNAIARYILIHNPDCDMQLVPDNDKLNNYLAAMAERGIIKPQDLLAREARGKVWQKALHGKYDVVVVNFGKGGLPVPACGEESIIIEDEANGGQAAEKPAPPVSDAGLETGASVRPEKIPGPLPSAKPEAGVEEGVEAKNDEGIIVFNGKRYRWVELSEGLMQLEEQEPVDPEEAAREKEWEEERKKDEAYMRTIVIDGGVTQGTVNIDDLFGEENNSQ